MIFSNSVGWAKNHVEPLPISSCTKLPGISRCFGETRPCEFWRWMVDWNSDQDITVICNPESYRKFGIPNIAFTVGAWYLHVFATRIYLTFWNEYVGYLLQPPSSSHFFNHLWEVTESGRLASRHFLPILVLGKLESRDLGTWFLTLNDEWLTTACHLQHILFVFFLFVCWVPVDGMLSRCWLFAWNDLNGGAQRDHHRRERHHWWSGRLGLIKCFFLGQWVSM